MKLSRIATIARTPSIRGFRLPVSLLLLLAAAYLPAEGRSSEGHPVERDDLRLSVIIVEGLPNQRALQPIHPEILEASGRPVAAVGDDVFIAWLPDSGVQRLRGAAGVQYVARHPADVPAPRAAHPDVRAALGYLEWVNSGARDRATRALPRAIPPGARKSDVRIAADLLSQDPSQTDSHQNNVLDDVHLSVFLAESNGTIDANSYTWTWSDYQTLFNQVIDGTDFWGNLAWQYGRTAFMSVAFYSPFFSNMQYVVQGYEPITRASYDDGLWISAIMNNRGYTSQSGALAKVRAYNHDTAVSVGRSRAVSAFIAYNPPGAPGTFTDGYSAFAWLGDAYFVSPFRPFGYDAQLPATTAHELAHLFWACDEYYSPGYATCSCALCGGTANPRHGSATNGNCEAPTCNTNPTSCIMLSTWGSEFANRSVCDHTKRQLGWIP